MVYNIYIPKYITHTNTLPVIKGTHLVYAWLFYNKGTHLVYAWLFIIFYTQHMNTLYVLSIHVRNTLPVLSIHVRNTLPVYPYMFVILYRFIHTRL